MFLQKKSHYFFVLKEEEATLLTSLVIYFHILERIEILIINEML